MRKIVCTSDVNKKKKGGYWKEYLLLKVILTIALCQFSFVSMNNGQRDGSGDDGGDGGGGGGWTHRSLALKWLTFVNFSCVVKLHTFYHISFTLAAATISDCAFLRYAYLLLAAHEFVADIFFLFVWHFCSENTYLSVYFFCSFFFSLARRIIRLIRKEWKNDRTCSWIWTLPVFAGTDNVSL